MDIFKKLKSDIAQHGFFAMSVFPSERSPGFAYTVGLTESAGHPELLIFGLPPPVAHIVMHDVVERIQAGAAYGDGDVIADVLTLPVAVKSISTERASEYTVQLFNYYGWRADAAPTVLQVVLPDRRGRFPWSENFEHELMTMQPALWEVIH